MALGPYSICEKVRILFFWFFQLFEINMNCGTGFGSNTKTDKEPTLLVSDPRLPLLDKEKPF